MEHVSKTNIFGLKMIGKSGLEKKYFEITNSFIKITFFAHGVISKINNCGVVK